MKLSKGFTLLEIMVSIAILAISLVTLLGYQGTNLIASMRAERITIASFLARSKMVDTQLELSKLEQLGEYPEEKEEKGQFEQPFEEFGWRYSIKPVSLPAPMIGEEGSMQSMVAKQLTSEIGKSVRELKVSVTWVENGEEQSVDLATHFVKL